MLSPFFEYSLICPFCLKKDMDLKKKEHKGKKDKNCVSKNEIFL